MKIKPISEKLIVKRTDPTARTESGIIIPEAHQKHQDQGKVVGAGPGRLLDNGERAPMNAKPGDRVLFSRFSSKGTYELDNEEYICVLDTDVLAILDEPKPRKK